MGTPEEFNAATEAVLDELSFMGGNQKPCPILQVLMSPPTEGKVDLADQLGKTTSKKETRRTNV